MRLQPREAYRTLIAFMLALLSFRPSLATAESAPFVLFLEQGDHARAERVRAELDASGFSAQVIKARSAGDLSLQLAALTLQAGAQLGLALRVSRGRNELLIYDAEQGLIDSQAIDDASTRKDAFALRVVELLRARRLVVAPPDGDASLPAQSAQTATAVDVATASEPPAPAENASSPAEDDSIQNTPSPMPQVQSTYSQQLDVPASHAPKPHALARSYVALELGAALLVSAGGLGPSAALSLAASIFLKRALRLGAYTLLPLSTLKHESEQGSSATRVTLVGLDFGREFFAHSALRTALDGGFSVAILATEGQSSVPDLSDTRARRATFGSHLRGSLAYHFSQLFSLRAAFTIGAQFSAFALEYAGHTVARWGLPWSSTQLAIELRF